MNYLDVAYNMGKEAAWTEMFGRMGERLRGARGAVHDAFNVSKETRGTVEAAQAGAAVAKGAIPRATADIDRLGINTRRATTATGAAIGGVGGAIAGGENHRWSGALGGAALGAGLGYGQGTGFIMHNGRGTAGLKNYKNVF